MAHNSQKRATANSSSEVAPRPRRKRLLWTALAALAALAILVALGPTLVSVGFVKDLVLAWASGRAGIRLAAEELHLAWLGNQTVRGLTAMGPDGERLAHVGEVRLESRLVDLLADRRRLGPLVIEDVEAVPRVLALFALVAPGEEPAHEEAPKEEGVEKPAGAPLLPSSVRIRNLSVVTREGTIRIPEADFTCGEAYDLFRARAELVAGPQSGTAEVEARLTGLSRNWQGGDAVGAEVRLQCDGVPLAPVWQTLMRDRWAVDMDGTVSGQADIRRSRTGELTVRTEWDGRDLAARGDALAGDRPTFETATLRLDARWAAPALSIAILQIDSPVATLSGKGTFDFAAFESAGTDGGRSAAVAGEGRMEARVLLAPLAAMLPHTIGLLEELQVTSGRLETTLEARTGEAGSALEFTAALADLAGTRDGRPLAFPPVTLQAKLLEDSTGWTVNDLRLSAPFASLSGRGRLEAFALDADLDLAGAAAQVSQFLDLAGRSAKGAARLRLETDGTFADGVSLVVSAEAEDLLLAINEERHIEEPHATFAAAARATFDERRRPDSLTVTSLEAAWSAGSLKASGAARRQDDAWSGSAKAQGQGEVGPLARQVAEFRGRPPGDISGRWQLAADLSAAETGSADFSANVRATGLAVPVPREGAEGPAPLLALEDVSLSANASYGEGGGHTLSVQHLRASAPGVEADAKGSVTLSQEGEADGFTLAGDGSARTNLAALEPLLRPFGLLAPGSRLAGTVAATAKATTAGGRTAAEGRIEATDLDLHFAESQTALREARLTAPFTASYDSKTKRVTFETTNLSSALVKGSVRAALAPADGGRDVELDADIECDGPSLQALLGARLPQRMTLGGAWRLAGRLRGKTPDEAPSWNQKIAGLAGEGEVGVGTLAFRGLNVSAGTVPWKLAAGKLLLGPEASRPASLIVNEGTVRLAGAVDLTAEEPRYVLKEPLQAAEDIHLTGELAEGMLSYISPLMGQSVSPTGRMALKIRRADLPLGPSVRRLASAEAEFTIYEFRSRLKGPLALLAVWAGAEETVEEQVLGPYPILLRDGRFQLRDQKVSLHGGVELQVDGTVGLDGTMETVVGVPLTESLLKKFGVPAERSGPWTGRIVHVPLTGTVRNPKLDEKRLPAEMLKIVGEAILSPERGSEGLEDLLKDVLKKPSRDKPAEQAPTDKEPPAENEPAEQREAPTLQDLIDLFKPPADESAPPAE